MCLKQVYIIVCVKELLKPLHKLKVVLELALYKLVNRNNLKRCQNNKQKMSCTLDIVHHEYILCNKAAKRCGWLTYFANTHLFETGLNKFKVVDEFMLKFGLEFHFL